MQEIAAISKALGEENRLRAVTALQGREMCVCQLTELLGLAPSTVSKHMAVLRAAGLVESWKEGRWVHYRLANRGAPPAVRQALAWAAKWLQGSPRARQDAARLKKILRLDKEELCRRQGRCRG
ncbi:MAG: ArsR family transcriptional regulator [Desulfarculus sp.]|nr:MAG: ArsR family transcriptional regulator [Desulfarculus sp.]